MPASPGTRRVIASVAAAFLAVALAGCAGVEPELPTEAPTAGPTRSATPTHTATPTPTPTPPTLRPGGSAAANLPFFEQTLASYVGAYGRGERALLVGHLRGVGFDPATIEAGWATTPNGLQEVSIEAAVRFGSDCLVGTVRQDRWAAAVMPVLSTGHCLIGDGFRDPA